jgi:tRNA (cmo5U34)-methyltransferase
MTKKYQKNKGGSDMDKDNLFAGKNNKIGDFNFGEKTAEVFDDMLERSVPLYRELQRMIGELASEFAADGSTVYDLGCSTGITLGTLISAINKNVKFVGVDYSQAMLDRCGENLARLNDLRQYELVCCDLNKGFILDNASVVVLNLTLQFIRPLYRDFLIGNIYRGLNKNGCIILVEKVLGNDSMFNRIFIKFYYDLKKRNEYSEMEIAQKREALENVLIPYRLDENIDLLKNNDFSYIDIFYKWYNFCGIVAVK